MLKLCLLTAASWMEVGVTGYKFESWPPKDHSCHVCYKLPYWFKRRRLLNIFFIGSYVKTKSSHGGHLEFPIGKRFTFLVQDHPMIIPAKSQFNWLGGFLHYGPWQPCWISNRHQKHISDKFGSILFSGFREEDLNVKS